MEIKEYKDYKEAEIRRLYTEVGWTAYIENMSALEQGYKNSLLVLAAYESDDLLGIIRVVGDGHSVVFIQDILIFPEYQRQGIGTALLKQILQDYKHVYQKHLLTENTEKTIQFYKSLGFTMDTDMECRAFSIYF